MRYDIILKDEASEELLKSSLQTKDTVIFRDDLGDYDEEYVRNFIHSDLYKGEYDLAIKYGEYHDMNENRVGYGQWLNAIIAAKIIYQRDIGVITEEEKLDLEVNFLNLITMLSKGHFKTVLYLTQDVKDKLSPKLSMLVSLVEPYLQEYIDLYY